MRYLQIDVGHQTSTRPPWWVRALAALLPSADPDLQAYYSKARTWWLEIDDNGAPLREIGFDAEMNPIVLAPAGRNVGFLIDSAEDWSDSATDSEEAARGFQKTWESFWPTFQHLDK